MLSPFLIIGLGGSGGKTLQVVKDGLLLQLRQAGWKGGLPAAWQLLQIDVPPQSGEFHADLPDPLSGDEYIGLAAPGVSYDRLDAAFTERINAHQLARQAAAGWRPRASFVTVPIERGAGQYRAIGRVLTVFHISRIKRAIDQAIARMQGLNSEAELKQVAGLLGESTSGNWQRPTAIVVSSIAGGTGAGMFMDVCDVLRLAGPTWCDESVALLYTPDVFDEIPEQSRRGVRPNALGAMAEILAGFWDQDGFGEDEEAMLSMFGGIASLAGVERIGPRFPFLVGRSNGSISFKRQNDSYRSMGRALSAWMTRFEVQSYMSNYLAGNWAPSAQSPDRLPFRDAGQELPFQAIGFGRLGLGRDRFQQYAAERLARSSIDRLLEGHMENLPPDHHRSSDQVRAEVVEKAEPEFLASSGLNLEARTAITTVLDSAGFGILRNEFSRYLVTQAFGDEAALPADQVRERSLQEAQAATQWESRFRTHYRGRLKEWVRTAPVEFVTFVLQEAAARGIPVTLDLLDKLSNRIVNQGVVQSLTEGSERARQRAHQPDLLNEPLGGNVGPGDPEAQQAVEEAAQRLAGLMMADALAEFADLMRDFERNVVRPVTQALKGAHGRLKDEATDQRPRSWPRRTDTSVPARHEPTPNERVLLSGSEFDETLKELLRRQYADPSAPALIDSETAIDRAIERIVSCTLKGEPLADGLFAEGKRWIPAKPEVRPEGSGRNAGPASISINLRPERLFSHAKGLLTERQTPIGVYMSRSMAEYFSEEVPPDQLVTRLQALRRELAEVLKASAPLVSINPSVANTVHETSFTSPVRIFSGIPFAPGSQARAAAEEVLADAGLDEMDRASAFRGEDSSNQYIDIFTMLPSPVEACVIDSLCKPIREEWEKATTRGKDTMVEFWRFRRTRPLPQAIPIAPNVRTSMARGWFSALVLGQIRDDVTDGGGLSIFVPRPGQIAGSFVSFPTPLLLPPGSGRGDRLAGVMKNSSIAMLEANAGNMEGIGAYSRLRDLGTQRTGGVAVYRELNAELASWIRNGSLPEGAPIPNEQWAGSRTGTSHERRDALVAQFKKLVTNYQQRVFGPVDKLAHLDEAPRAWELRKDYLGALEALIWAIETFEIDEEDVDL